MSIKRDLLVVGHTALDYIITVKEFPKANYSAPMETMLNLHGGAAANVAMVGATLGLKTSLISAVGKDFIDSAYYKTLVENEVNVDSMIISKEENTSTCFVMTDNNKDQISYFYWGAGKEFASSEVSLDAIREVKSVHLATGDPYFNCKCGIAAKGEGKLVSFDPGQDLGMYSSEKLKEIITHCDILFGNHHEIGRILNSLSVDIDGLMELGPSIIVKSCGKEGSIVYNYGADKINVDAIYRPAVDPTGAGDSYRASFIFSFLNGESLEDCAKFASAVSSFIVEKQGCQTNIPTYDEAYGRMIDFYK